MSASECDRCVRSGVDATKAACLRCGPTATADPRRRSYSDLDLEQSEVDLVPDLVLVLSPDPASDRYRGPALAVHPGPELAPGRDPAPSPYRRAGQRAC